jgi:hypothetical protein
MLHEGDTLVAWKLDLLGRSVKQLVDLVGELHKQGVQFKSLTDAIDTDTPSGRFFFHVMASLAEMERELIVERTRAGLDVARQLGVVSENGKNLQRPHQESPDSTTKIMLSRLSDAQPRTCQEAASKPLSANPAGHHSFSSVNGWVKSLDLLDECKFWRAYSAQKHATLNHLHLDWQATGKTGCLGNWSGDTHGKAITPLLNRLIN